MTASLLGGSERAGMTGPNRKSASLKLLQGNPGKRKITPGAEPVPVRGLPECPARFTGTARDAWTFLSEQACAMRMDYRVDALALEGACTAYARATGADAVIESLGPTFTTPNGYVQQRPEISISMQNWKLFKSFCSEWGFTPASRTRLNVTPGSNPHNHFANLAK